jgi:hypothetical protein
VGGVSGGAAPGLRYAPAGLARKLQQYSTAFEAAPFIKATRLAGYVPL